MIGSDFCSVHTIAAYLLRIDVPIYAAAAGYVVHDTLEEVGTERVQVYLTASLASAIMTSNSNKCCNNV